ncbi:DnaA regulatory inactivator Hda [Pseudoluteimonas lycopersici]|uniref:DnaA regulatory inactivator Hda n=2 Tax=Pseudoluteimonas lycopersici TaxID=1324796 RepID=A0A516V8F5_9GAMM|nr:DnaA regulatory inactivator Hda [Lysobacter lycopersici]
MPPDQRFDTFVAAPPAALAQLRALARGESSDAIYVEGAHGTGKSHLLRATCAGADALGRSVAYLPLESLRGRLRDALELLAGRDLVAVDGLEAIAGEREDEVALFDLHNRTRAEGVALFYAASAAPAELGFVLPDLVSRLSQCHRIALSPLDDDDRREVLRLRARHRGVAFDDAAIDWLLRRAGRDLAGLTALLDRLDRASLAAQRRITVPFLREVLGTS